MVGPELFDARADVGWGDLRHDGQVCHVDLHLPIRLDLFAAQPRERGLARLERTVHLVGLGVHEHRSDHASVVLRGDREHPEQAILPLGCDRPRFHDAVGAASVLTTSLVPDVVGEGLGVRDHLAWTLQVRRATFDIVAVDLPLASLGVDRVDPHEREGITIRLDRGQVLVGAVLHRQEERHLLLPWERRDLDLARAAHDTEPHLREHEAASIVALRVDVVLSHLLREQTAGDLESLIDSCLLRAQIFDGSIGMEDRDTSPSGNQDTPPEAIADVGNHTHDLSDFTLLVVEWGVVDLGIGLEEAHLPDQLAVDVVEDLHVLTPLEGGGGHGLDALSVLAGSAIIEVHEAFVLLQQCIPHPLRDKWRDVVDAVLTADRSRLTWGELRGLRAAHDLFSSHLGRGVAHQLVGDKRHLVGFHELGVAVDLDPDSTFHEPDHEQGNEHSESHRSDHDWVDPTTNPFSPDHVALDEAEGQVHAGKTSQNSRCLEDDDLEGPVVDPHRCQLVADVEDHSAREEHSEVVGEEEAHQTMVHGGSCVLLLSTLLDLPDDVPEIERIHAWLSSSCLSMVILLDMFGWLSRSSSICGRRS